MNQVFHFQLPVSFAVVQAGGGEGGQFTPNPLVLHGVGSHGAGGELHTSNKLLATPGFVPWVMPLSVYNIWIPVGSTIWEKLLL